MKAYSPYSDKWTENEGEWMVRSGENSTGGFATKAAALNFANKNYHEDANGVQNYEVFWMPVDLAD